MGQGFNKLCIGICDDGCEHERSGKHIDLIVWCVTRVVVILSALIGRNFLTFFFVFIQSISLKPWLPCDFCDSFERSVTGESISFPFDMSGFVESSFQLFTGLSVCRLSD